MSIFQRAAPARPAPTAPSFLIPTIQQCIQHIAAYDADRARVENGVGFNKMDSDVGNMLARKPFEQWHGWERKWAFKRLSFYRRQLEAGGLRWDLVPEPAELAKPDPIKTITVEDRHYRVTFAHLGDEFDLVRAAVAMIPGRRFVAGENAWLIPRDSVSAPHLKKFAESFGFKADRDLTAAVFDDTDRATLMLEGSRAIAPFMPFEGTWKSADGGLVAWPHQEAGRAYGKLANYRLLISDEMGTGKSGLALMMAEDAGCFEPDDQGRTGILIICPSVVKPNWGREAKLWVPNRTVTILKGTGLQSVKGDIVIANYDILRVEGGSDIEEDDDPFLDSVDLVKLLKLRKWAGIVCDEAHYAKDPGAQRTIAIAQIIKATQPRVRLMLSGSPILNRLTEFVPAMNFAGILERFGGAAQFMANYSGARNSGRLVEMNAKFREAGYLCRLKEHHAFTPQGTFVHIDDVPLWVAGEELRQRFEDEEQDKATIARLKRALEDFGYRLEVGAMKLPRKMAPSLEVLELSDRKEYDRAVAEFRSWLWEQIQSAGGDMDSWNNALRAEALVKLNKLRQLVGRLKAPGAIAWAQNFMESSEEKLVMFVEHDDPMNQLLSAFPNTACITGGQTMNARQENIDRFQSDPACRLMVAKTKAGGVGVTLTAASHVAILELPWNPGTLDQAVDRIHRGGQTKTVYPHYFLAEKTIDAKMALLIDEKRKTVTAATHGGEVPAGSQLTAMLEDIAA